MCHLVITCTTWLQGYEYMAKEKEQVKVLVFDLAWPHYFVRCHITAVDSCWGCKFNKVYISLHLSNHSGCDLRFDDILSQDSCYQDRPHRCHGLWHSRWLWFGITGGTSPGSVASQYRELNRYELLEALAPGQLQVNTENLTGRNYWRH